MTFRQISEVALDGVSAELQAKIGWHTEATGSIETLNRSPVAPQVREGGPLRMGMEKVTGKLGNPAELGGQETSNEKPTRLTPRVMTSLGRADMSMVTVTAATKGKPLPSAVIIDIAVWKAEHQESSQTRIAAHDRITSPPASHSKR